MYAQQLNNSAALCIEIGYYDRAIVALTKALRLWKLEYSDDDTTDLLKMKRNNGVCHSYHCSVDGCLYISENIEGFRLEHPHPQAFEDETSSSSSSPYNNDSSSRSTYSGGYIYRKPIQIASKSIMEGHNMGYTVYLIIVFNLALSNHLKAITSKNKNKNRTDFFNRALAWYNHAMDCQARRTDRNSRHQSYYYFDDNNTCNESPSSPLPLSFNTMQFNMIVLNNTSQVYRISENHDPIMYQQCLHNLLSKLMLVIDCKSRIKTIAQYYDVGSGEYSLQSRRWLHNRLELNGFVWNTASLILQEQCADVAWW